MMKKTIRAMALFAVLGVVATGCQRDNYVVPQATVTEMTVNYSAGDLYGSTVLTDDAAWDAFLDRMLALAREGYEVTIFNGSSASCTSSKEVVTYTTDNEDDAKHWAKHMFDEGYQVTIKYDDETGIYTCTAVK